MPHMPHDVPATVEADYQTIPFIDQAHHSETAAPAVTSSYIPLAQRTSDQLQANAHELRRMAATATTEDIMRALLTLRIATPHWPPSDKLRLSRRRSRAPEAHLHIGLPQPAVPAQAKTAAPAAVPQAKASIGDPPRARASVAAARKASPAPTELCIGTSIAGIRRTPFAVASRAPSAPS